MTIRYVDPAGDDTDTGGVSDPFETIVHGLSVTVANDTLRLNTGTYDEQLLRGHFVNAGTAGNWVTIEATSGHSPIIMPSGTDTEHEVIRLSNALGTVAQYIRFLGNITVDGTNCLKGCIKITQDAGGVAAHHVNIGAAGNGLTIKNASVSTTPPESGAAGQGVAISNGAHDISVIGNTIKDNGIQFDFDHGVYISGGCNNCIITHNAFSGNNTHDIQIFGGGAPDGNIFAYNTCRNRTATSIVITSVGGINQKVYNNLIWDGNNQGFGIELNEQTNCLVANNVFVGHAEGINIKDGCEDCVAKNNIMWLNSSMGINDMGVSTDVSNNLDNDSDPLFTDQNNGDFTLSAVTSPAVDMAVNLSVHYTDDYAGNSRPEGSAWDIGAYEFDQGGGPSVPVAGTPGAGMIL